MSTRKTFDTDVITLRRIFANSVVANIPISSGLVLYTAANGEAVWRDVLTISSINAMSTFLGDDGGGQKLIPGLCTLSTQLNTLSINNFFYQISTVSTVFAYGPTVISSAINVYLSPYGLCTTTISTGNLFTSSLNFIDNTTNLPQVLGVSSGTLLLNGSPIVGDVKMGTITSTVVGLGSAGYVSSAQLLSTSQGLKSYIDSFIDPVELTSSIIGLGTQGFVSTVSLESKLVSTVTGLGSAGYISSSQLLSTTQGIVNSLTNQTQITSTVIGLGTAGYISTSFVTSRLTSTVVGLGTAGYLSSAQLLSTSLGLKLYIDSFIDPVELASTVIGLGTQGFVSTIGLATTVTSTVTGLGTAGYLSTSGLQIALTSTVAGLGSAGYVSSSQLLSTTAGIPAFIAPFFTSTVVGLGTAGYLSSSQLLSTSQGLARYISTFINPNGLTSTVIGLGTASFVSSSGLVAVIVSTVTGLGSAGYVSSSQLLSTTEGVFNTFVYPNQLTSSVASIGNKLTSTVIGLGTAGYVSTIELNATISTLQGEYATSFTTITEHVSSLNVSSLTFGYGVGYLLLPDTHAPTLSTQSLWTSSINGYPFPNGLAITIVEGTPGIIVSSMLTRGVGVISLIVSMTSTMLISTVAGLGSAGYISSSQLLSSVAGLSLATENAFTSTVTGLGTAGYVSSSQLLSSIAGINNVIGPALGSTMIGLGSAGYVSSSQLLSSVAGINNVIGPSFGSTVTGLGTAGYVSSSQLLSTTYGIYDYINTFIDPNELTSTVVGLGTQGFISTLGLNYSLASTVTGLGTLGYVSTSQLLSTTLGVYQTITDTANIIGQFDLTSTVTGLGTAGYISSAVTTITAGYGITITPTSGTGNVTVTAQAQSDGWIQTNLVLPPSSIYFLSTHSKTSQIFLPWVYPAQINVGFQSAWLPVINSFSASLSTNIAGFNPSTFMNRLSSSGIVSSNNGTPYVTGIVLTKVSGSSGVQQNVIFPQDGVGAVGRTAYMYYDPVLSALNKWGEIIAYYHNYNNSVNQASTIFAPFVTTGPPTAAQRLQASNITSNALNFYFSTPQFVDSTDPESVATIISYLISYTSVPVAGSRYGTPVYDSNTVTSNTPFTFFASPDGNSAQVIRYAASLYPESTYTFSVTPTNSANQAGPPAVLSNLITSTLTADPILSAVSFTSRYYATTVKRLSDSSNITNLVNTNTDWTTASFTIPVQTTATRGTSLIGACSLSTFFTSPEVIVGPTVFYNGFPAATPATGSQSNLVITPSLPLDKFNGGPVQKTGYFLNAANSVTIQSATFAANSTIYTLHTKQYQSTSAAVTSSDILHNFYYDGDPGTAIVKSLNVNFTTANPTSTLVSGVAVLGNTLTFSTITTGSNLGRFFYASPLVNYTNTIQTAATTATETTLTNIISGYRAGQFLSNQAIVFSNGSIQSGSLTAVYSSNITMTATVNNAAGSSASYNAYISSLVDGPSVSLLATIPTTRLSASTSSAVIGCRVWSYTSYDATTYVPPFIYGGANSYTNVFYNHRDTILTGTASNELQVGNGAHRSKGSTAYSYVNYSGLYYNASNTNTFDYSGVTTSGIRFATFAWNTASSAFNYAKLTLVINYLSNQTDALKVYNDQIVFSNGNFPSVAYDKIYVYYRVEDNNSLLPTTADSPSTVWLDANGTIDLLADANTYFIDTTPDLTQIRGGVGPGSTLTSSQITFPTLFIPAFSTVGKDIRILCRIGIPMKWNFAFTTVTARMAL